LRSDPLSENEKTVLLSILRNPEHSDMERASSLGLNHFTFNKIKNHLVRDGLFKREYVPNYCSLGFEIFVASFGSRMEPFIDEKFKAELGAQIMGKAPGHIVFFISEPGLGLGFHAVEDFTSMKNGLIRSEKVIFDALGMERSDMTIVPFSFRDMKVGKIFDLNDLIAERFALDIDVPKLEPKTPGQVAANLSWDEYFDIGSCGPEVELNDTEWSLLVQLVSHPDGSDQFHVDESGLSRYRFKRIRDFLLDAKFIKPLIIPNIQKVGLEVLIFSHLRFKPSIDPFELWESGNWKLPSNLILMIMDRQDAIGIGLYPNLSEGSKAHHGLLNAMVRMNILEGNPHVQVFSLGNLELMNKWPISFADPLIQKGNWAIPGELLDWLKDISSAVPGSQPRNQRSP
jgi:hypothetical protein